MITIKINDTDVSVPEGTTIMQAAEKLNIHIPRLCYHPALCVEGSCRVCIVEVKDMHFFMAACSVLAWDGMAVQTSSPAIRQARRDIVELLLDNHPTDCNTCVRNGNCELQRLAAHTGVHTRRFSGRRKKPAQDNSSAAVVRNPEKCILCGRCVRVCRDVQGVENLSQHGRGFNTVVGPANLADMDESVCIQCGQCINVCPTAAFKEKRHTNAVWNALADPDKHVVVQTAPSIRAALGEGFEMPAGTPVTGKMITALRRLGFDVVFDTNFAADVTIMEEGTELAHRLRDGGPLPMLTSCSPGWVSFLEKFYPELIPNVSSCKSPMSMLSTLTKTYYAEKRGLDPSSIFNVAVMPCVAKKYEAARSEHRLSDKTPATDAVLTTRELIWMIKSYGIEFETLPGGMFDRLLGMSSGAGDIFGTTGGVMEAALRLAGESVTGDPVDKLAYTDVRGVVGLKKAEIDIGDQTLRVAVANGLINAKRVLDEVSEDREKYHIVEIMACPGGCIGGGGQPYPHDDMAIMDDLLLKERAKALYSIDEQKQIRRPQENPEVTRLYNEFLQKPNSDKAHELLHTTYHMRHPRGIR
ncbi:MAG: NADH-dependent [FeFe] hydrogenase, group A6 [Myxococcota bacterium]|nr:NADH-dependent [FeFe] hydrogenase, group A6 [Myxococcota bacterium]